MAGRGSGTTLPALLLAAAVGICAAGSLTVVVRHTYPGPDGVAALSAGGAPGPAVPPNGAVAVDSGAAGPDTGADTPAALPPEGVVWAVVVGIDDYPGTRRDLEQAVADADEMLLALRGLGVQPERTLALRDGEATADGILAAADWLVANAGPHDTAVLFYAGHVRKLGPGVEGILAADLAIVADSLLAERLAGLGSRDAWLFIAACYGGGFTELLAPGRVLTAAADAESISYESRELARSYVVEYAIHQALVQRRTAPVVQEAVAYAWNQLAATFPDRQLTSFDHAGHPIVLQRGEPIPVEHDASPLAGMVPTGTDGPGEPPAPPTIIWYHPPPTAPPPSSPPATAPAPPPPTTEPQSGCQGLLAILCG